MGRCHTWARAGATVLMITTSLGLWACSGEDWEDDLIPSNFNEIRPGEAMFGTLIGEPLEGLRLTLGRQDFFSESAVREGDFFLRWIDEGVIAYVNDTDGDGKLEFDEPITELQGEFPYNGQTLEGIGLGSTRNTVETFFGTDREGSDDVWEYTAQGISFVFIDQFVVLIQIYEPQFIGGDEE